MLGVGRDSVVILNALAQWRSTKTSGATRGSNRLKVQKSFVMRKDDSTLEALMSQAIGVPRSTWSFRIGTREDLIMLTMWKRGMSLE